MALYRTHRPKAFAEVIGQDHVVTTLENAIKQDKLAHAYLFAGSRGTGKTSVARILAKAIMTRGIEDDVLKQQIVKGIEDGSIVDLLEIDAASNRGIDDVRDLIEKIQFSPVVASAKVYIIDEVHMLTKEAFNALLKTLEEPPDYAYFILATTELQKIPSTIQSRCQGFPFRHIREEDIIRHLQDIADREHIPIDREALRAIAHHVEGGMRDAISLLDQLRSLEKISITDVEQRIGTTGHEEVEQILKAIDQSSAQRVLEIVRHLEETGIAPDTFLRQILNRARKQLHQAVQAGEPSGPHVRLLDTLLHAIRDMRSTPVPALALEAALVSLCETNESALQSHAPKPTDTVDRDKPAEKSKPVPTAAPTPPPEKRPENSAQDQDVQSALIKAKELSLENIRTSWKSIVDDTQPASVRMSLKDAEVASLKDTTLTLAFGSSFHRNKVSETEASRAVETALKNHFKKQVKLKCELHQAQAGDKNKGDSVNLAEAAAEIF